MPITQNNILFNQEALKSQFKKYLQIIKDKHQQTTTDNYLYIENLQDILDGGHCSGFAALWIYNILNNTQAELFASYKKIYQWDGSSSALTQDLTQIFERLIPYILVLANMPVILNEQSTTFAEYLGYPAIPQYDYEKLCSILINDKDKVFSKILDQDMVFFSNIAEFEDFIKKIFHSLKPGHEICLEIGFMDHATALFFKKDNQQNESLEYYCANSPTGPISNRQEIIKAISRQNAAYFDPSKNGFMLAVVFFTKISDNAPFTDIKICDYFHDFTKIKNPMQYLCRPGSDLNSNLTFDCSLAVIHNELIHKILANQLELNMQDADKYDPLDYMSFINGTTLREV